jgi:NAD(P)-dependent dehydrogenase (short-subunit alcohol dehydrogenase family)
VSRLVVVTGGGSGIGRAIVERFRSDGEHVIAVGRGSSAVDEVCDVTDEQGVESMVDRLGDVDVLVNNAGVAQSDLLQRTTLEQWRHHLDVNATGPFLCTRAVLPGMVARNSGRIITVASVAGVVGARYTAAYTASKHAAVGLMRAVAAEVAGTGVTVNAVCPTYTDTTMTDRSIARIAERTGITVEESRAAIVATSALGRLLAPAEVAAAAAYLASDEAAAINGQALVLDGGPTGR